MPGAGKGKDADLGLYQDGSGTNKGARLNGIMALGKRAGLLNSPYEFKREVIGQWA